MQEISRRRVLASLGGLGGGSLLAGCASQASIASLVSEEAREGVKAAPGQPGLAWDYLPLEPTAVAETAYRIYPEGGCMYAVVGSVVGNLAKQVGEPFRSFPIEMMCFGDGGVGGWGSLCGVVNGGAALIGLFHREKPKETRKELIAELCVWYETSPLPCYKPREPQWADEAKPSVADSVLCHVSTAHWCEGTGYEAFSMEKKERCRRLATDGAVKIVDILNRKARDENAEFVQPTPEVRSCLECHGPKELGDAMGKMSCSACHQFDTEHP